MNQLFSNRTFHKADYTAQPVPKGEYEQCLFDQCDFYEADLSGILFADCTFRNTHLSMARLSGTLFRNVVFTGCKMLGTRFEDCNEFGLSLRFESCQLQHASFYKTRLKQTLFTGSQLQEADFSEADLTGASFADCELAGAVFDRTILEQADFRTARNYLINPQQNRIRHARFSLEGVPGLLAGYQIDISI